MNVKEIELQNFLCLNNVRVLFPPTGIVMITGPNGTGKSSVVEAVGWAGWGKMLRGTKPSTVGKDTKLLAQVDGVEIARSTSAAGTTKMRFSLVRDGSKRADVLEAAGTLNAEYLTASKSQDALETMIGDYELWRRAHVFTSVDAVNFSTSSDAERKQFIERLLGISRFDEGLATCKEQLKLARQKLQRIEATLANNRVRVAAEERRWQEANDTLAEAVAPEGGPDTIPAPGDLEEVKEKARAASRDLGVAQSEVRQLDMSVRELQVIASQKSAQLDRVRADACPTCAQPIPESLRERITQEAEAAQKAAKEKAKVVEYQAAQLEETIEELSAEASALRERQHLLEAAAHASRRAADAKARWDKAQVMLESTLADAKENIARLQVAIDEGEEDRIISAAEVAELEACEQALGMRGVRAMLMDGVLRGFEALANCWLSRFFDQPVMVTIASTTERKSGAVVDAISIQVDGVGGGQGYKAASAGERRRIDVALLLALRELAEGAQGDLCGTLFFDEVFDCLDEPGTLAIVDALKEMAVERCVVVITHSKLLMGRLAKGVTKHYDTGSWTES